jgi:tetratricopeptide (TPR) repeat protein
MYRFLLFTILISVFSYSAGNDTVSTIQNIAVDLEKDHTFTEYLRLTRSAETILNSGNDSWLSYYYTTFGYIQLGIKVSSKKRVDKYLDKAKTVLDKGLKKYPDNSELLSLDAFIYQIRIRVAKIRAIKNSKRANEILDKIIASNPDNPRALFLKGQNLYYTPSTFGGGCTKAIVYFKKAKTAFESSTDSLPSWGKKQNLDQIKKCNRKIASKK